MMTHPQAIFVQPTTTCNGRCVFCPHSDTYRRTERDRSMSDAVWNRIIVDLAEWGYTGQLGLYLHCEPFADPGLFDKMRDVNEKTGAYLVLSTNGSMLDERRRAQLIEARPRKLHINVPSGDAGQYELLTGLSSRLMVDRVRALIAEANGSLDIEVVCLQMPETTSDGLDEMFAGAHVKKTYWACSRGGLMKNVSAQGNRTCFNEQDHCVQATQNLCILWDGSIIACANDWAGVTRHIYPAVTERSLSEIYAITSVRTRKFPMCAACIKEHGFCES